MIKEEGHNGGKIGHGEKNEDCWEGMRVNVLNRKLRVVIARVTFEQKYEKVREFVKSYQQ